MYLGVCVCAHFNCMCICMCVCVFICKYAFRNKTCIANTSTCVCAQTKCLFHTHVRTHTHTNTHRHTQRHTSVHTHTRISMVSKGSYLFGNRVRISTFLFRCCCSERLSKGFVFPRLWGCRGEGSVK